MARTSRDPSGALLALVAMLAALVGCTGEDRDPEVGSETHFLTHCTGDCGPGLTCLCGVCTKACTGDSECSSYGERAACVPLPASPEASAGLTCAKGATCDAQCLTSADCTTLGADFRCDAGYCRRGTSTCPTPALVASEQTRSLLIDGRQRDYVLHVPAGYTGESPVPLVLDFHAMGSPAGWQADNSGFRELAEREGFLVAWPEGLDATWDLGPCCTLGSPTDDFAFARAIVRQLTTLACVDPKRIYATGFSLGAGMSYYLGCRQAELFAAVAASGMDLFVDAEATCQPSRPVTEISFRGTADTVVPYTGGVSSPPGHPEMLQTLLGAVGTFEKWAAVNGCDGEPSAPDTEGCSSYTSCENDTEVTLCSVEGQGQVMGSAERIWQTLSRHEMP